MLTRTLCTIAAQQKLLSAAVLLGSSGVKGRGGKVGGVRKPRQRPRFSKGALMDLEIQVGDMKEEQVPQQSFEVVSLYKSVSYFIKIHFI